MVFLRLTISSGGYNESMNGVLTMTDRITQEKMDELKYCLVSRKDKFPALLEEYTGIIAKPYIAFQYFSHNENYISDSDNCSLEELMEEVEIEVVAND